MPPLTAGMRRPTSSGKACEKWMPKAPRRGIYIETSEITAGFCEKSVTNQEHTGLRAGNCCQKDPAGTSKMQRIGSDAQASATNSKKGRSPESAMGGKTRKARFASTAERRSLAAGRECEKVARAPRDVPTRRWSPETLRRLPGVMPAAAHRRTQPRERPAPLHEVRKRGPLRR